MASKYTLTCARPVGLRISFLERWGQGWWLGWRNYCQIAQRWMRGLMGLAWGVWTVRRVHQVRHRALKAPHPAPAVRHRRLLAVIRHLALEALLHPPQAVIHHPAPEALRLLPPLAETRPPTLEAHPHQAQEATRHHRHHHRQTQKAPLYQSLKATPRLHPAATHPQTREAHPHPTQEATHHHHQTPEAPPHQALKATPRLRQTSKMDPQTSQAAQPAAETGPGPAPKWANTSSRPADNTTAEKPPALRKT